MSATTDAAAEFLASNPRMIGVLFMIGMLVSQVGTVLGGQADGCPGP